MTIVKRPPPATKQFAVYRREVKRQLQLVVDKRAKAYGKVTQGWQAAHQPDFQGQVVGPGPTSPKPTILRVVMRNASKVINKYGTTIRNLWDFWNKGTRRHPIVPRFKSILRFVIGGDVIFTPEVDHPGTRAHKDQEKIDRRLKPVEAREIKEAGRVALKAVERLK